MCLGFFSNCGKASRIFPSLFSLFVLCWRAMNCCGLAKRSTCPFDLVLVIIMQLSTMQVSTHAPQYMQSSSANPTSPVLQNKAPVGHALMQSLHSAPLQVLLLMLILPLAKRSFTPERLRSFFLPSALACWVVLALNVLVLAGICFILWLGCFHLGCGV